ncbi:scopoletin glucosyltransferase-like [Phalaenopsis equestris]|uniref:scopoletin glucosyltransferase-like n=1 Tax=Phalaenopsis equestris TaxID=78828 RepID=UPI0009E3FD7F|nr:scopoletin glucosyltransferase-like [Phalaenopsis equestris]
MASTAADLHIFFLPLLAPGHMIPILDLSILISARGARSTIITTPSNADLILRPSLSRSDSPNIHLLTIPFASDQSPNLTENLTGLRTPEVTPQFFASLCLLEPHFESLVIAHRPDCIISDVLYPWSAGLAKRHGIPRIAFHGTSYFSFTLMGLVGRLRLYDSVSSPDEPFVVPDLPHDIKLTRSQLFPMIISPPEYMAGISASLQETYGMVMNTFYELEPAYADSFKSAGWMRGWNVGPVFLRHWSVDSIRNRGGAAASDVFDWLDGKKARSVLYVCFGSLPRFTAAQLPAAQLREIREGLEAAGRPFVWVVRGGLEEEGYVPVAGNGSGGFVIRGWAPQLAILKHEAVGGFLTHCGWNSCMEGIAAGVPMVTWPLFADQQFNERLLVDVLGVGVGVGSVVNSTREEERTVVVAERVAAAVEGVMGGGEEAEERRRKAREMKEAAEKAVREGGASEGDLGRMVEELLALKRSRVEETEIKCGD